MILTRKDLEVWRLTTPFFTPDELSCRCGKCGGELKIEQRMLEGLHDIRTAFGKPMRINSGYRCPLHPIEATKVHPGEHGLGLAVDVGVAGADAVELLHLALQHGIKRIGINQRGPFEWRYIHLGWGTAKERLYGPTIWTY